VRPVGVTKKSKKKDKDGNLTSGELAIRRDHPRRRIEIPFAVVGDPRAVV